MKTGSFFFPGGNVTYQGEAVTQSRREGIAHNYKDEQEWRANIETVLGWFTRDGLDLVTLYFGEPDSTGHKFGPDSEERKRMVEQVDRTVGYLRTRIREEGLESRLNLIITSDHGMNKVNKKAPDLVEFHKFANFSFSDIYFELLDYGPNGMLYPKEGRLDKVYEVLKNAHPRLHVYKKEDFPKDLHYAGHSRITPLVMYSDPGYVIHGVRGWAEPGTCPPPLGGMSKAPLIPASPPYGRATHPVQRVCVHTCICPCVCMRVPVHMCACKSALMGQFCMHVGLGATGYMHICVS